MDLHSLGEPGLALEGDYIHYNSLDVIQSNSWNLKCIGKISWKSQSGQEGHVTTYKTGKSRGWSYFTIKALHALRNKVQLFFSPLQPLSIFSDIQGGRRKNLEEGTFSAFLSFYSERAGHSDLSPDTAAYNLGKCNISKKVWVLLGRSGCGQTKTTNICYPEEGLPLSGKCTF